MKPGQRKFLAFLVTITNYTLILGVVIFKLPNLAVNLDTFSTYAAAGYCAISGLFYAGNAYEHFVNKPKKEQVQQ